jgi:hypothetical protein
MPARSLKTCLKIGECMNTISRDKVRDVVEQNAGKIFSCVFIKKNGDRREMLCRTGVKKYLKGGTLGYDPKSQGQFGLITVCEVKPGASEEEKSDSYRHINIDTIMRLTIGGESYQVINVISGGLVDNVNALDQEVESTVAMAS